MRRIIHLLLLFPAIATADNLNCPCIVVEVIDGDTVYVQDHLRSSRKVWLAGIDAPELDQPYGEQSRSHLIQLVEGKPIEVVFLKRDRYGRIIGKLIHNKQDINLGQIKNGFSWYFRQNLDELSRVDHSIYRSAENTAKSQGLGLWSLPEPIPPWEYRSSR